MSNRILGIGVVVAGFVASAAVTAYVMREPAPVLQVTPAGTVSRPSAPELLPTNVRGTNADPVRQTQPQPVPAQRRAATPAPMSPVIETMAASAPPAAEEVAAHPKAEVPPSEPLKFVPEPIPTVQAPAPAVSPEPECAEITVGRHSVIGIRLDYAVSSRTAKIEDRISATVSRHVMVEGRVAIPEGARLEGTITGVDRGSKFRERPRLSLQFDTMILTDGTRMSIKTDEIVREGDSPSADGAAKVGAGTAAGAILGSVLGGKKGAVIGGVTGAAAGTATVMSGDGNDTALKPGAPLTVRLTDELVVLVRKQ